MKESKGQIALEFLLNFLIWFSALTVVSLALLNLATKEKDTGELIHEKVAMNDFANLLEHGYLNKNREIFTLPKEYRNYKVGAEISKDFQGKAILGKTIYGVEQTESEPV